MRLTRPPPGSGAPARLCGAARLPTFFFFFRLTVRIFSKVFCVSPPSSLPPPASPPYPDKSYHCPSPKKMPFSKMDPSCTIGFYSRSAQDYERIRQELSKVGGSSAFTLPQEPRPVFLTTSVYC